MCDTLIFLRKHTSWWRKLLSWPAASPLLPSSFRQSEMSSTATTTTSQPTLHTSRASKSVARLSLAIWNSPISWLLCGSKIVKGPVRFRRTKTFNNTYVCCLCRLTWRKAFLANMLRAITVPKLLCRFVTVRVVSCMHGDVWWMCVEIHSSFICSVHACLPPPNFSARVMPNSAKNGCFKKKRGKNCPALTDNWAQLVAAAT